MAHAAAKLLARYWGYLALTAAVAGTVEHLALVAILTLAGLAFIYMLVQAPLVCGATTRAGEPCRENSHGLLLGCWRRQHKWQRARRLFVSRKWDDLAHTLLGSAKDILATVSALIAIATPAAAAIGHL